MNMNPRIHDFLVQERTLKTFKKIAHMSSKLIYDNRNIQTFKTMCLGLDIVLRVLEGIKRTRST
jgi:hypothetical protein